MTTSTEISTNRAHESPHAELPNLRVSAANGIEYAYRDTDPGDTDGTPLVLLQRFRGNLEAWILR